MKEKDENERMKADLKKETNVNWLTHALCSKNTHYLYDYKGIPTI